MKVSGKQGMRFAQYKRAAEKRGGERLSDEDFLGMLLDYYKEWPN